MSTRSIGIYFSLAALWLLICGWMSVEHRRLANDERDKLLLRANDISSTVAVVIRSQGRFGIIVQSRLDDILEELSENRELKTVALINSTGEVVSELGDPLVLNNEMLSQNGSYWLDDGVLIVNVVDFGPNTQDDGTTRPPTILIREEDISTTDTTSGETEMRGRQREDEDRRRRWESREAPPGPPPNSASGNIDEREDRPPPPPDEVTQEGENRERRRPPMPRGNDAEFRQGRKFWHDFRRFARNASGEDWERLHQKRGLYGLALKISTKSLDETLHNDLLMRFVAGALSLAALLGLGVAWRNFEKTNQLQLRLVRLDELNNHLQEMNIASAGLAHETRNPLNIIRGIAQTISQGTDVTPESSAKLMRIVAEADRVAGRLNEFINYSRPVEPKLGPVNLEQIVEDVQRTLTTDLEEKSISMTREGPDITIEADEMHLRQMLFNLVLNAIQSTPENGEIRVAWESANNIAQIEIADNGPGVDPAIASTLFKPYVTTREEGTGLGLAVVRQIALAHHWEATHHPNQPSGAIFRLQGIKVLG